MILNVTQASVTEMGFGDKELVRKEDGPGGAYFVFICPGCGAEIANFMTMGRSVDIHCHVCKMRATLVPGDDGDA